MTTDNAGIVRVLTEQCSTCIFRPGNKMSLNPGRLAQMVADCKRNDGHIPCHETMIYGDDDDDRSGMNVLGDGPAAICAGFAQRYEPTILQLARRLGVVIDVPPPPPAEWLRRNFRS